MRIPRTLIREVAGQAVMFLNRSGMEASQTVKIVNCKMKNEDFSCLRQEGKEKTERFCNLQSKSLHFASETSHFKAGRPGLSLLTFFRFPDGLF